MYTKKTVWFYFLSIWRWSEKQTLLPDFVFITARSWGDNAFFIRFVLLSFVLPPSSGAPIFLLGCICWLFSIDFETMYANFIQCQSVSYNEGHRSGIANSWRIRQRCSFFGCCYWLRSALAILIFLHRQDWPPHCLHVLLPSHMYSQQNDRRHLCSMIFNRWYAVIFRYVVPVNSFSCLNSCDSICRGLSNPERPPEMGNPSISIKGLRFRLLIL